MAALTSATASAVSQSSRPGMGTILYRGGVAFRVWAPFATEVFAAGTFNQWSSTAHPFAHEGNGYWSVDVPGAKIGDEYRFVIRHGAQPLIWRQNPYASEVINSSRNAIIHDPNFDWTGDHFTMPPWNELVIYEMHVGTFHDAPRHGHGTFDEVVLKLPYLRDLGINAIEIMPVAEFPMDYSWGYNPSQPFAVESALGGPSGLYKFVKAAHAHGIAVILDVVYNHCGPGDLDLWRFDGWWSADHDGGIYFYDRDRARTPWGDTRPDYGRGEVRQFFRDNALFWLNKYRLDGLRFDSVVNIRNRNGNNNDPAGDLPDGWGLLQWINHEIRVTQPWKITVAEDLQNNAWITKDTGAGGAGFGSQWDAGFVHPIRRAITCVNDSDRDLLAVRDALDHRYNGDALQRVIYTESHDEVANGKQRVPAEIWPGHADSWFSQKTLHTRRRPGLHRARHPDDLPGAGVPRGRMLPRSPIRSTGRGSGTSPASTALPRSDPTAPELVRSDAGTRGQHSTSTTSTTTDKVLAFHRWEDGGPGDDVVVVANFANRSYESYASAFRGPAGGTCASTATGTDTAETSGIT